MNDSINDDNFDNLSLFYNRFKRAVLFEKGKIKYTGDVPFELFKIFHAKKKTIKEIILKKSLVDLMEINKIDLDNLIDKNYIRKNKTQKKFHITLFGLFYYESKLYKSENMVEFLNLIDKDYFQIKQKKIDYKARTLLWGILALRCFNADSCVDLNDEYTREKWYVIYKNCFNFLKDLDIVTKDSLIFDPISDGMHDKKSLFYWFRRSKLILITNGRFKPSRRTYYLEIQNDINQIRDLVGIVLGKFDTFENRKKLVEFSKDLCRNYKDEVFVKSNPFAESSFDSKYEKIILFD